MSYRIETVRPCDEKYRICNLRFVADDNFVEMSVCFFLNHSIRFTTLITVTDSDIVVIQRQASRHICFVHSFNRSDDKITKHVYELLYKSSVVFESFLIFFKLKFNPLLAYLDRNDIRVQTDWTRMRRQVTRRLIRFQAV